MQLDYVQFFHLAIITWGCPHSYTQLLGHTQYTVMNRLHMMMVLMDVIQVFHIKFPTILDNHPVFILLKLKGLNYA